MRASSLVAPLPAEQPGVCLADSHSTVAADAGDTSTSADAGSRNRARLGRRSSADREAPPIPPGSTRLTAMREHATAYPDAVSPVDWSYPHDVSVPGLVARAASAAPS